MTNTTEVDEVQQAALDDLAKGYQVIPLPARSKNPCRQSWQQEHRTLVDVQSDFSSKANISRLNGEPSGGLMDVDLDADEAIETASEFLPDTSMIHGRASKRRSHYWFTCDPPIKTARWQDVDGAVMLEVRGSGTQTVIPPSVHPEGEKLEWAANGEPGQADPEQLLIISLI